MNIIDKVYTAIVENVTDVEELRDLTNRLTEELERRTEKPSQSLKPNVAWPFPLRRLEGADDVDLGASKEISGKIDPKKAWPFP